MYMDIQMPWVHGCTGAAHSPKNLSMALSAEVAEIVEHFQWLTEEHIKGIADVHSSDDVWFSAEVLIAVGEK